MGTIQLRLVLIKEKCLTANDALKDRISNEWNDEGDENKSFRFLDLKLRTTSSAAAVDYSRLKHDFKGAIKSESLSFGIFFKAKDRLFFMYGGRRGQSLIKEEAIDKEFPVDVALKIMKSGTMTQLGTRGLYNFTVKSEYHTELGGVEHRTHYDPLGDRILFLGGKTLKDERLYAISANQTTLRTRVGASLESIRDYASELLAVYLDKKAKSLIAVPFKLVEGNADLLNAWLIEKIKNKDTSVAISTPHMPEIDEAVTFHYLIDGKEYVYEDLLFGDYLSICGKENVNIDTLKRHRIRVESGRSRIEFSVWDCLEFSEFQRGDLYFISGGSWKVFNSSAVEEIKGEVDSITRDDSFLPIAKLNEDEGNYSARICSEDKAMALMDKKSVPIGSRYSKVEVCDVIKERRLCYLKPLTNKKGQAASSHFTYVFHQLIASADLLSFGSEFRRNGSRNKALQKVGINLADDPFFDNRNVVLGIMSSSKGQISEILPTVSLIALRNTYRYLRARGINLTICVIYRPKEKSKDQHQTALLSQA